MQTRRITFLFGLLLSLVFNVALANHHESDTPKVRVEAVVIEAEVLSINYETREASLALPMGYVVSLVAGPEVERLEEIKVGDRVITTYLSSLAGEVREPTEDEKMQPFVVLTEEVKTAAGQIPGRAGSVLIRAVCTVEGMNRITGRAMIKDVRGNLHVIEDVPTERFEGVTLGSTVIITYTQAVAIAIEKRADLAEE
jgi:hypothetical protein